MAKKNDLQRKQGNPPSEKKGKTKPPKTSNSKKTENE